MPTERQRRENERRRQARQNQRRQQRYHRRRRFTIAATVVGVLAVIGLVVFFIVDTTGSDKKTPAAKSPTPTLSPTTSPTASTTPSPSVTPSSSASAIKRTLDGKCTFTKAGSAARKVNLPAATQSTKGTVTVDVQTNRGAMTFTLDRKQAPCTVGSFVSLVQQKFYDKTPCPRIESTSIFILQCGDPTGTGAGGPGYTVPDEYTGKEKYTTGTLAMANTGQPNSGGSQFFIVYKTDALPPSYTIFGKVTGGLSVVDKVAAGGNDGSNQAGGGKPKLPISIQKMTVAS